VAHKVITNSEFRVGLNEVLETYVGTSNKLKEKVRNIYKYNHDYWKKRPLPRESLDYAAEDVAHLLACHRAMVARMSAADVELVYSRSRVVADSQRKTVLESAVASILSEGIGTLLRDLYRILLNHSYRE
jgi:ribonuclease D